MEGDSLSTWKPSPGDSNQESPDMQLGNDSNSEGIFYRALAALTGRGSSSNNNGSGGSRFTPRFMRRQVNGRHVNSPSGSARAQGSFSDTKYWGSIGPLLESKKLSGTTSDFPVVAPPTAPSERKKLILDQTSKKLENISAEWTSKTDFLFERFSGVCANARNEAELALDKLEDFSSEVYEFSAPSGLTGLMIPTPINGRYNNTDLKYLQMELQVFPERLNEDESPIANLPGSRSMQVVLKLPTNPDNRSDIHPGCTRNILSNPTALLAYLKATDLPIEFGMTNTRTNLFDASLFEREHKKLYHECLFHAIKSVLYRDYVGDSIVHDTLTRLQRCKQSSFVGGRHIVKRIQEFHSEFMLIVNEYDPRKPIPCNLAQVEFHNLIKKFQDRLTANNYKPPQETGPPREQYQHLAKLKEEALKVENELDAITDTVRSISGVKRANPSSNAFMASTYLSPSDIAECGDEFHPEDEDGFGNEDPQVLMLAAHLSVAEDALRRASGERAPIKCYGCQDIPDYKDNCFHRFSNCPHKKDPRVHEAYHRRLQEFGSKRSRWGGGNQHRHYGRGGQQNESKPTMFASSETDSVPNNELAAFVATTMADPTLKPDDRARIAGGFTNALAATHDTKSPAKLSTEESKKQAKALMSSLGISEPPTGGDDDKESPQFRVFVALPHPIRTAAPILNAALTETQRIAFVPHSLAIVEPAIPQPSSDWSSTWEDQFTPSIVAANDPQTLAFLSEASDEPAVPTSAVQQQSAMDRVWEAMDT